MSIQLFLLSLHITKVMYDALKLEYKGSGLIDKLNTTPFFQYERTNTQTGELEYKGKYKGLSFKVNDYGLTVWGSAPKFLYENNLQLLDCDGISLFLENLSDEVQLDMENAVVKNFEFTQNFSMNKSCRLYFDYFANMRGSNERKYVGSLIWENTLYAFKMYDKLLEMEGKGVPIPKELQDEHLLRLECKYKKPTKIFGCDILASTLHNKEFYTSVTKHFKGLYDNIKKVEFGVGNVEFKSMKEFDFLCIKGAVKISNLAEFLAFEALLNDLQQRGKINKFLKGRIKKKIEKAMSFALPIGNVPLIHELTTKVSALA